VHCSVRAGPASAAKATINVTFVKPNGTKVTVKAPVGDSMLEVAHANDIDIEGESTCLEAGVATACPSLRLNTAPRLGCVPAGACGGETACSTCHIIVDPAFYAKLPKATESEEDMLDLAAGLTKTSRLGCQVRGVGAHARLCR